MTTQAILSLAGVVTIAVIGVAIGGLALINIMSTAYRGPDYNDEEGA